MKTLMIAASAAVLSLAAMPAAAQAQAYGTVGYAGVDAEGANIGALQGRVGYKFNPVLAVEGEAAFGIQDDTVSGIDVKMKHEVGVFGVVTAPISPSFDLFARAGYTGAKFETSLGDVKSDGFAYGVGGQYNVTAQDGIRLDWTRHDHDDVEADVWSIGYSRKF
ncbi:MAG: porin family protein [Caulobacter sp.]|nr:porin family protein [Caulobacter sp.]